MCKFIVTSKRLICLFCSIAQFLLLVLYFCCFGALFALFQRSIFLLQVLYFRVQVFYFSCPGALFDRPPPSRGLAPQSLPYSQHGEALFVNCSTRIRHVVQRDSSPYLINLQPLSLVQPESELLSCLIIYLTPTNHQVSPLMAFCWKLRRRKGPPAFFLDNGEDDLP